MEIIKNKIYFNISKLWVYKYYVKLTKDYLLLFFTMQIISIVGIVMYIVEGDLFVQKVYLMLSITTMMLGIRYMYIYILKRSKWDGKYPISDNEVLKHFFIKYNRVNKICYLIFKYVNLGRIVLVGRNGIMIKLRYIRYLSYKNNVWEYWIKIEKILMYVIYDIIVQYIKIIINDIYIPGKHQIVNIDIKYLLLGRVQFLIFICLGKGVIPLIVVILLMKLVKLMSQLCVNWAKNEYFRLGMFNRKLMQNSYIFRNLQFSKKSDIYIGYNKIVPGFNGGLFSDSLYENNKKLQYMDIYGGLQLTYIAELNIVIKDLFDDRIFVEYCLVNEEFNMYKKDLKKLQEVLIEIFLLLNKLIVELKRSNACFELVLYGFEFNVSIELVISKVVLNEELNNINLKEYVFVMSELVYKFAELRVDNDNMSVCYAMGGLDFIEKYNKDEVWFKKYIYNTYIVNIFIPEILKEE